MAKITPQTIEFVKECARAFESENIQKDMYIGEDYIGLKFDIFDDSIKVFELGNEIGCFSGYINKPTDKEKINYTIMILQEVLYKCSNNDLKYFTEEFNKRMQSYNLQIVGATNSDKISDN